MPATVALSSELTTLINRVTAVEGVNKTQTTDITAMKADLTAAKADITLLKTLVAPPIGLPPPPQVQWSAGMETGNLSEWSNGPAGDNTGSAISTAVQASAEGIPPRGGLWVMKQAVSGPVGGTRMARYPEVVTLTKAGIPFYWSWWDYFPTKITFSVADMFQTWQIASVDAAGVPSPIWGLYLDGSNFTPRLGWSPSDMAGPGPHAGETGKRFYTSTMPVPIGQWVFFEAMIKPAADYTGALKIWMNTVPLFDLSLVRTRFADAAANATIPMYISQNGYGSGLTPTPAVHYVDDVSLSLNRMTYP